MYEMIVSSLIVKPFRFGSLLLFAPSLTLVCLRILVCRPSLLWLLSNGLYNVALRPLFLLCTFQLWRNVVRVTRACFLLCFYFMDAIVSFIKCCCFVYIFLFFFKKWRERKKTREKTHSTHTRNVLPTDLCRDFRYCVVYIRRYYCQTDGNHSNECNIHHRHMNPEWGTAHTKKERGESK